MIISQMCQLTRNLMVLPCAKTVKKTMARAVVKKSSLYQLVSSRTAARENPTAPLIVQGQKLLKRKTKAKYQPESSVGNDDLLLPADSVGAELVHHRREQDRDQEPGISSLSGFDSELLRNLKRISLTWACYIHYDHGHLTIVQRMMVARTNCQ